MARMWFLLCAGALLLTHAAPAPPLPTHVKDTKAQDIIVRRLPTAFFFPYNLWPIPKFPNKDKEIPYSYENFRYKRDTEKRFLHKRSKISQTRHNER